jgi:hypothetical protein
MRLKNLKNGKYIDMAVLKAHLVTTGHLISLKTCGIDYSNAFSIVNPARTMERSINQYINRIAHFHASLATRFYYHLVRENDPRIHFATIRVILILGHVYLVSFILFLCPSIQIQTAHIRKFIY